MEQIKANALFKIKEGKLEEFKNLIPQFIAAVKEKDPGTLVYDWYLNEEQMECMVVEAYADSNAVLAHAVNVGEQLQKSMELSDLSIEIYGNPSEELSKAIEILAPKVFPYFSGL
jgi:quinol monooxygenase YgiN